MGKILLINAINPQSEAQARFPNLGLGYLASSLFHSFPKNTFDIRIIDRNVEAELADYRPHLVGITAVSQNYGWAKKYAALAKSRKIPVIIGGVHVSALPQTVTGDMDLAVMGEAEETFPEIVRGFLETGNLSPVPSKPAIDPLDKIHPPARHLLKIGKHAAVFSSRGCPYRCTFCSSSRYWDKLRFFSAEYVIDELRRLVTDYEVNRISFYDDLMIANLPRLEKLAEMISADSKLRKIKFKCNARANLVTDKVAGLLSKMGVDCVGMGLESGNERTLRYLKGGSVSVHDNYEAVKILHRHGITANASFVIGSPDETEAEIMDTYRFIEDSGLDFSDVYVLTPFPGTPTWDYAKSIGAVSNDMDWDRLNVYHSDVHDPIVLSKTISKERMGEIYRMFKRQRLWLAARKAWFHPQFKDFLRAGLNRLSICVRKEKCA